MVKDRPGMVINKPFRISPAAFISARTTNYKPQTPLIFATLMKEIGVSGIRPTGFLHLGNYFGAVRNYVRMQEEYNCYFLVADWHSLTTHPDTSGLKNSVHRAMAENSACGLDPDKVAVYVQSD